ncbi:MAG: hypothetical protein HYW24_04185 [Candidatus Aenigmarchaeota archaeon]|nr:hypothetical protein [Candidatus Aenigmarchaeota archaeon]
MSTYVETIRCNNPPSETQHHNAGKLAETYGGTYKYSGTSLQPNDGLTTDVLEINLPAIWKGRHLFLIPYEKSVNVHIGIGVARQSDYYNIHIMVDPAEIASDLDIIGKLTHLYNNSK